MIARNGALQTELRANMRGGKGTVKVEHWFRPEAFSVKSRLCARLTIEPGGSIGTHTHDGEDEIYLVLSGTGRIEEQGEWVPIQPGDAILTGQGGSHGVEITGSEPLVIAAMIVQAS